MSVLVATVVLAAGTSGGVHPESVPMNEVPSGGLLNNSGSPQSGQSESGGQQPADVSEWNPVHNLDHRATDAANSVPVVPSLPSDGAEVPLCTNNDQVGSIPRDIPLDPRAVLVPVVESCLEPEAYESPPGLISEPLP
jgi:hypothetical protein